jgi:hypothetical protein
MVMPLGFQRFSDALRCGVEIFHSLKKVLKGKKFNTSVGDEGGFAPDFKSNREALDQIMEAITKAGYTPGQQVFIALDVASTEFYDEKKKVYKIDGKEIDSAGMVGFLADWVAKYPICSIEDGCAEDDSHQGEPNRHADRNDLRDSLGPPQWLYQHLQPSQRRDGGLHHRRSCGGVGDGADQDGLRLPQRSHGEIQSPAAD